MEINEKDSLAAGVRKQSKQLDVKMKRKHGRSLWILHNTGLCMIGEGYIAIEYPIIMPSPCGWENPYPQVYDWIVKIVWN